MYISAYLPQLLFISSYTITLCLGRSTQNHISLSGTWQSPPDFIPTPAVNHHARGQGESTRRTRRKRSADDAEEFQTPLPPPVEGTSEDAIENLTVCNGHAELCTRRYSEVTVVGTHNSAFVQRNSLAANQELDVHDQLDDGVRFLQAQMHWARNDTEPHFCHTSCDILDAGPITDWLSRVRSWVDSHPYDVITVLLGNGNYSSPEMYAPYIESSGLVEFAYVPPSPPADLQDWPTLEQMLRSGKRVVMMLDYKADEVAYPWLLDEFSYMWETPFDPLVNSGLPCSIHRPPNLSDDRANSYLYLLNHNINIEVSLAGQSFLIPAVSIVNQTNAASGSNSLGESAERCRQDWMRPPTVLNVDYYNHGRPPGSVFQVAATMNGVLYNKTCCGKTATSGTSRFSATTPAAMVLVVTVVMWSLMGA